MCARSSRCRVDSRAGALGTGAVESRECCAIEVQATACGTSEPEPTRAVATGCDTPWIRRTFNECLRVYHPRLDLSE